MSDPKTFEEAVDLILADMKDLLIRKQKDYGPKNILDFGLLGVLVRSNDKMARLRHLYGADDGSFQAKEAKFESIADTWMDLANYAVIAQMLQKKYFLLPMEAEDGTLIERDPDVLLKADHGERDPGAEMRAEIEMLKEQGEH